MVHIQVSQSCEDGDGSIQVSQSCGDGDGSHTSQSELCRW